VGGGGTVQGTRDRYGTIQIKRREDKIQTKKKRGKKFGRTKKTNSQPKREGWGGGEGGDPNPWKDTKKKKSNGGINRKDKKRNGRGKNAYPKRTMTLSRAG